MYRLKNVFYIKWDVHVYTCIQVDISCVDNSVVYLRTKNLFILLPVTSFYENIKTRGRIDVFACLCNTTVVPLIGMEIWFYGPCRPCINHIIITLLYLGKILRVGVVGEGVDATGGALKRRKKPGGPPSWNHDVNSFRY